MSSLISINDLKRHVNSLTGQIEESLSLVINSGWFVLGSEVLAFEQEFADYCGATHCVSVANGTDALELALRALDIGTGNIVLTVANAGMYSSVGILATGATPLYADISPHTLLLDVLEVKRLLDQNHVDAIIITHLYGLLVNIEEVVQIAQSYGIPVLEDCAQAHGAQVNGRRAGSFGHIACFSFYPTKNLGALGDGGAVVTSRKGLAERVTQLRQYGWGSKYSVALAGGRNSRLDELQAAILRIKLPLLDSWNARRRAIAARYSKGIKHSKITVPKAHDLEYVAHLYVVRSVERDKLRQHLFDAGIPSDVHYPIPDYRQEAYRELFTGVRLPVTEKACHEVLTLPCFPEMIDAEVDAVVDCVNSW